MATVECELIYTVQVDELRPGDFVARALAFPNQLALGDTEAEAVARATSLLQHQIRDACARGEPAPGDVISGHVDGRRVTITVAG
jgi:predicted RNase H-like HicB family nuclease